MPLTLTFRSMIASGAVLLCCSAASAEQRAYFRTTPPGTTSPTAPAPNGWTDITGGNTGGQSIPPGGSVYFAVTNIDSPPPNSSKSLSLKLNWLVGSTTAFSVPTATGVTGSTASPGYVSSAYSRTSINAGFNAASGFTKCPDWEYITLTNQSGVAQPIQIAPTFKTECSCKATSSTGGPEDDTLNFSEGTFGVPPGQTTPLRVTEIQIYPEMVQMDLASASPLMADPGTGNWTPAPSFIDPEGKPRPDGGIRWTTDGFGLFDGDIYGFSFSMDGWADDSYIMFMLDGDTLEYTRFRVSLLDPPWYEDFDEYDPGSFVHGGAGWEGFGNDPTFDAPLTGTQSHSAPNAVDVSGDADVVRTFEGADSGKWQFAAWQYIPGDFQSGGAGQFRGSYLVIFNTYDPAAQEDHDWSIQMQFDSNDGMLKVYYGNGLNTVQVPYDPDRWVKIQAVVDLDDDWTRVYYDDELVTEYPWTGGVFGGGGGAPDIAAVDLVAQGSSPIYYDDFTLLPILPCSEADVTTQGAGEGFFGYGIPDGQVTAADLNFFVNAWVAGETSVADVTTQGAGEGDPGYGFADGMVTASDLNYYVNLWIIGCP